MLRTILRLCRRAFRRLGRLPPPPSPGPSPDQPSLRDRRERAADALELELASSFPGPRRLGSGYLERIAISGILPRLPSLVEAWSADERSTDEGLEE